MSLASIFIIHLIALASPGPDFIYISQTAINYKHKVMDAILGVCTAIAIWAIMAIAGLSVIIEHFPIIFKLLLLLGGCYLIWLGYSSIASCFRNPHLVITAQVVQDKFFLKGLLTNLANPKALAYFGSIFSVAVAHASTTVLVMMFLLVVVESVVWFYLVARLFSTKRVARWYQKQLTLINVICGVVFILFGLGLMYQLIKLFH